jgi:hypothetical protein
MDAADDVRTVSARNMNQYVVSLMSERRVHSGDDLNPSRPSRWDSKSTGAWERTWRSFR